MRALFLTLYPESGASSRYRVLQFLPYLREHGVECTVACPFTEESFARLRAGSSNGRAWRYHLHEFRMRVAQVLRAKAYDVVVLQKAVLSTYVRGMAQLVRARARVLVYDIDDAVNLAPPHSLPRRWTWLGDSGQVNKLFARADLVLAGNDWLRESALAAGGRAEFFPTVVDTERFRPGESSPGSDFVIGWIGGPSTSEHLRPIAGVLADVPDATIRLVGADAGRANVESGTCVPWSLNTEVHEVQRFSVGVMPLPKSEWTRGKCALKALQYMACGVPCIATPFGAATNIIENNVNGLFATTDDDWRAAFEQLRDPSERRRIGDAGRKTVEERYSLRTAAPALLQLLKRVTQ